MTASDATEVTRLIRRMREGDEGAKARLLEVLYGELHDRAVRLMQGQPAGQTLQATALVNEAYLRILGSTGGSWEDRGHLLAAASTAMRHVLVDHVRARGRLKRRANGERLPLDGLVVPYEERAVDLEALDRALERLATFNPDMARAVELRFFGGSSVEETAKVLGMPLRTFERRWQVARAWLHSEVV